MTLRSPRHRAYDRPLATIGAPPVTRFLLLRVLPAAALALPAPALAAPAAAAPASAEARIRHYAQCTVVGSVLASNPDEKLKSLGQRMLGFFSGHIFGASPNIDFTALLRREAPTIDEARVRALLPECSNEMRARSVQMAGAAAAVNAERQRQAPPQGQGQPRPQGQAQPKPQGQ